MPLTNVTTNAAPLGGGDFPAEDESYFNVSVQVDPTWPHRSLFVGKAPGGRNKVVAVFSPLAEDGLSEDAGVNYATSDVLGRAEQYQTFTGGSNKTVQFTWVYVVQDGDPLNEVVVPARWLEATKFPVQDAAGLSHSPPPLLLTVGRILVARVITTDASIQWGGPFEPGTMYPTVATVHCTYTVVRAIEYLDEPQYGGGGDAISRFVTFPDNGATGRSA